MQVHCMVLSPDGKTLFTGEYGESAIAWDVSTGERVHTLKCDGFVRAAAARVAPRVPPRRFRCLLRLRSGACACAMRRRPAATGASGHAAWFLGAGSTLAAAQHAGWLC